MDWTTQSDDQILEIATPIMDNIMEAANRSDFDRHVRDFSPEARTALPRQSFESMCTMCQDRWGQFKQREFLGAVKKSARVWIVWRQWCEKTDDQFMASLCLFESDGRILVSEIGVT